MFSFSVSAAIPILPSCPEVRVKKNGSFQNMRINKLLDFNKSSEVKGLCYSLMLWIYKLFMMLSNDFVFSHFEIVAK